MGAMNTDLTPPPWLAQISADALNRGSFCRTLNLERLARQLERDPRLGAVLPDMVRARPHLFSSTVVFLSIEVAQRISTIVSAIENVLALPGYRKQALARAPVIAQHAFGPLGACMGYDFHLSDSGPQLIEVNTNAGGILLNTVLSRAQQSCCK